MAGKEPKLSFARIVSGLTNSTEMGDSLETSTSIDSTNVLPPNGILGNSCNEKSSHLKSKFNKQNKKSDQKSGNNLSGKSSRSSRSSRKAREKRTSTSVISIEVEPQVEEQVSNISTSPIILQPAPLPTATSIDGLIPGKSLPTDSTTIVKPSSPIHNSESDWPSLTSATVLYKNQNKSRSENINDDNHIAFQENTENAALDKKNSLENNTDEDNNVRDYCYFDGTSNGFYYQVSGSAGWRKSFGKQSQSSQHSSNNNSPPSNTGTGLKTKPTENNDSNLPPVDFTNSSNQSKKKMNNVVLTTAPRAPQPIRSNTIGGGPSNNAQNYTNNRNNYRGRRYDDSQQNNGVGNQQWASTSTARHNGNARLSKQSYNKNGQRSSSDYWHKGGSQSVDTGISINEHHAKKYDEQTNNDKNTKAYYQRNDRWQARNPHAPPPLSVAQRKARGPLPDWDEVAEAGADDKFDYMDLMESHFMQCQQYRHSIQLLE